MNRLFFVMGVVFLALLELAAGRHTHDSKSTDESEAECGSSEDCGLARPLCHEGQCIGISCDAHGLDGLWDDDWDGRPPIVGNFSISYFRYISKLGCLCMFNDWVSSLQRICDDNYGFFQLTLRHGVGGWEDGVLETWEFYLFGDASSIIVRDGFIVQHRKKVNHLVGVGFSGSPNMEKSHTTYELCFAVERGASVKVSLADAVSGEPNASACVSSIPQQERQPGRVPSSPRGLFNRSSVEADSIVSMGQGPHIGSMATYSAAAASKGSDNAHTQAFGKDGHTTSSLRHLTPAQ